MPQSNRPVPAVNWSRFRPQKWYTLNPLTRSLPGTLWVFGDRQPGCYVQGLSRRTVADIYRGVRCRLLGRHCRHRPVRRLEFDQRLQYYESFPLRRNQFSPPPTVLIPNDLRSCIRVPCYRHV